MQKEQVETMSNTLIERFKYLLEGEMLNLQVKRHRDAYSIMQEYILPNGEQEDDNYQWLIINDLTVLP